MDAQVLAEPSPMGQQVFIEPQQQSFYDPQAARQWAAAPQGFEAAYADPNTMVMAQDPSFGQAQPTLMEDEQARHFKVS